MFINSHDTGHVGWPFLLTRTDTYMYILGQVQIYEQVHTKDLQFCLTEWQSFSPVLICESALQLWTVLKYKDRIHSPLKKNSLPPLSHSKKSKFRIFLSAFYWFFFSRKSKQNIWVWKLQILKTLQIINQWLICSYMIAKDWIQLLQFILLINWLISSNPDFCQNLK